MQDAAHEYVQNVVINDAVAKGHKVTDILNHLKPGEV